MDRLELVGGILAEPLIFKYVPSEEDVVEIGIEDIGSDDDQSEDDLESKESIADCFQESLPLIKQENKQIVLKNEQDVETDQQVSEETYYKAETDSNLVLISKKEEIMATWEENKKLDQNGGFAYVVPKTELKDVILSYPNNGAKNRIEQTQLQEIIREKFCGNTTGDLALSLLKNGSNPEYQTATTTCQNRQAEQEGSHGKSSKETTVNSDVEKNNVNYCYIVDSSTDDNDFCPDESSDDNQEGTDRDRVQEKDCVTNGKRGEKRNLSISENKLGPLYPNFKSWKRKIAEKVQKYFWCAECDYKATHKATLISHITAKHTTQKNMPVRMKKCDRCPKMFKFFKDLRNHELYAHRKKKEFCCSACVFKTFCKISIFDHIRRHRESETLRKCSRCDVMISSKQKNDHMQKFHGQMLKCHACSYTTTFDAKLQLHLKTHKEVLEDEDYKYRCHRCLYETDRLSSFQVHKLIHLKPEEIEYFYCYGCNFETKRKGILERHILKVHSKLYKCVYCDFTGERGDLVRHRVEHVKKQ